MTNEKPRVTITILLLYIANARLIKKICFQKIHKTEHFFCFFALKANSFPTHRLPRRISPANPQLASSLTGCNMYTLVNNIQCVRARWVVIMSLDVKSGRPKTVLTHAIKIVRRVRVIKSWTERII